MLSIDQSDETYSAVVYLSLNHYSKNEFGAVSQCFKMEYLCQIFFDLIILPIFA